MVECVLCPFTTCCAGDMGFDGSSAMIQDANLDDSLYKNTDGASCFLMDGGTGFQADGTRVDDQPMAVDFDGGPPTHQEDGFASGGDDYGMQKPPVLAFVSFLSPDDENMLESSECQTYPM